MKKTKNTRLQITLSPSLVKALYERETQTGARPSASIALALRAWFEQ